MPERYVQSHRGALTVDAPSSYNNQSNAQGPGVLPLTDMHEHIRQSNLIEDIDSFRALEDSLEAWDFLSAVDELNHEVIHVVHRLVTDHQDDLPLRYKGVYRGPEARFDVSVGDHDAPRWQRVPELMDYWLELQPRRTAWDNHVAFETIHPYLDGNGRTGRMVMWWQETREGEPPTLFEAHRRSLYYRDLQTGRQR